MTFFVMASLLTFFCLACLIIPQLNKTYEISPRQFHDLVVYKDQLREIEKDIESGRLTRADADSLRTEVQRRILALDLSNDKIAPLKNINLAKPWVLSGFLTFLLVTMSVALYASIGSPGYKDLPFSKRLLARVNSGDLVSHANKRNTSVSAARIGELKKELKRDPSQISLWLSLGRAYAANKNYISATKTLKKAMQTFSGNPELLADLAEIRLMENDGNFDLQIYNNFREALRLDSTLAKPWFYLGLFHALNRNFKQAVKLWKSLIAVSRSDAPFLDKLREQIDRAAKDGGFNPATIEVSDIAKNIIENRGNYSDVTNSKPGLSVEVEGSLPTLSDDIMEEAAKMSEEERTRMINSMVRRLAERLEANPNDPRGWRRLAQVYLVLGKEEKAKYAIARAEQFEKK